MSYAIGDRIGDYEIVGILGAGGMGQVLKVRNIISDRVEAMKVLLPELAATPELTDRFVREIKVLAGLDHPNIAALRTAQRIDDQFVMIMELVEGITLEERLKSGPIAMTEALDYASQVLSGLGYAHERGVIHRDIKPANMMTSGATPVKLMDFGIAKVAGDKQLTRTGMTMGSLYYMSPEQIKGGELDARSDLYSFGVTLYELVTGARPFRGDSDFSIMSAHLEKQPVPPIEVDPELPTALNEIILMSIAKEPAKRFQSAAAFRAAIESIRAELAAVARPAEPAAAAPMPPPTAAAAMPAPVPQARSSHRGLYVALGAVLAIAVLAVGALQLPKWLKTRAVENQPPTQESVQPPPAVQQEMPATELVPLPTTPGSAPGETPSPATRGGAAPVTEQAPRSVKTPLAAPATRRAQPVMKEPLADGTASSSSAPTSAPSSAPPQGVMNQAVQMPMPTQDRTTELRAIQKSWPMLASRAGAISSSLQNLQREQQRQGFGLRGDIAASWKRMEHYMDQVEAALSAKDPDAAKENLEDAEREIGVLEKFLGR